MYLINGILHTMAAEPIERGYVAFEAGKITAVGPMDALQLPPQAQVLDVNGCHIYPGLVDAHSHLGVFGDSLGFESDDGNEITDPVTPQLRAIDAINPFDRCFAEAREGGVTCVVTGPGSANAIGGQIAAIKTAGRRVDDMIVKAPVAMKFALGENPKSCYNDRHETPITRMATAALIREELFKAQEYLDKQQKAQEDEDAEPPEFDMKLEALVPVLKGELPAHFHAHRADDIATAVRIAKEFHLNFVIIHGTEAHLIADLLAQDGVRVVTGPIIGDRSKPELANQRLDNTATLKRAGVLTAICTDHPENPQQYLPMGAAVCVKHGLPAEEAMAAITCDAARIAGLDDRLGTLEVGKDADIAVFRGHPLEVSAQVEAVFIDGERVK
jgi:imidazolonepropionase-like amidohydrolase